MELTKILPFLLSNRMDSGLLESVSMVSSDSFICCFHDFMIKYESIDDSGSFIAASSRTHCMGS